MTKKKKQIKHKKKKTSRGKHHSKEESSSEENYEYSKKKKKKHITKIDVEEDSEDNARENSEEHLPYLKKARHKNIKKEKKTCYKTCIIYYLIALAILGVVGLCFHEQIYGLILKVKNDTLTEEADKEQTPETGKTLQPGVTPVVTPGVTPGVTTPDAPGSPPLSKPKLPGDNGVTTEVRGSDKKAIPAPNTLTESPSLTLQSIVTSQVNDEDFSEFGNEKHTSEKPADNINTNSKIEGIEKKDIEMVHIESPGEESRKFYFFRPVSAQPVMRRRKKKEPPPVSHDLNEMKTNSLINKIREEDIEETEEDEDIAPPEHTPFFESLNNFLELDKHQNYSSYINMPPRYVTKKLIYHFFNEQRKNERILYLSTSIDLNEDIFKLKLLEENSADGISPEGIKNIPTVGLQPSFFSKIINSHFSIFVKRNINKYIFSKTENELTTPGSEQGSKTRPGLFSKSWFLIIVIKIVALLLLKILIIYLIIKLFKFFFKCIFKIFKIILKYCCCGGE